MPQCFTLAYGKGTLTATLPEGIEPQIILPNQLPVLPDPLAAVRAVLAAPTGTPPLLEQLRQQKPEKIVIVVNDETRPTPYDVLFPPLLEVFAAAGIKDEQVTFVIATGIHDPHSQELNERTYGKDMVQRFRFVNHVASDDQSLTFMGRFASGYDFYVNSLVVEADYLITIGVVMPHYFAGFSGGRKSILPGLAGHHTVEQNHARMVEIMDNMPPIRENPISLEMIEAARSVGVNFILNTVTNSRKELVKVVGGDLVEAWYEAVDASASMFEIPFTQEVDICLACACGYPRDVNMYQAQKALDHADHITRKGGTIILLAQCPGGFGEDIFEAWMRERMTPPQLMDKIMSNFVLGGHKGYGFAKVAVNKEYYLISDMSAEDTQLLYGKKAATVEEALALAFAKHGPAATLAVLPEGSLTLPVHR